MNTYHPSRRRPETNFNVVMNEQPRVPHTGRTDLTFARVLIESGHPPLVKRGRRILRRIQNRRVIQKLHSVKKEYSRLDETGARLLANRRTEFIRQIEEKENGNVLVQLQEK